MNMVVVVTVAVVVPLPRDMMAVRTSILLVFVVGFLSFFADKFLYINQTY